MGQIDSHGDLAIAQIAFFAPAFCIALFVTFRHGFSRSLGWFYVVTLSILRLIGASCLLYIQSQNDYSTGLLETAAITSAVGTAPLLLALLGFLERVNAGMQTEGKGIPNFPFQVIHLVSLGALAIAIVGGVKEPTTLAAYTRGNVGTALLKAASILFIAIYFVLAAITVLFFLRKRYIIQGERKLIYAGLAALPFLLVRMLYSVLVAFYVNQNFYYRAVNVYVEAFMQFLMEAIVVVLFIAAGLLVPKQAKQAPSRANDVEVEGMGSMPSAPQQKQHQQKSLGDYRPSRMIANALRGN